MGKNQNKMRQNKNTIVLQDVVPLRKSISYENDYNNLQKESIHGCFSIVTMDLASLAFFIFDKFSGVKLILEP
jgi:hypothetical protein